MMWFFAALIVLAMGGVAALAAGHGTPMSQAYDDRPDASVPARGPLAADDLRRVRFSLAFRGYRMSEVDALLERLAAERDRATAFARPEIDSPDEGDSPADLGPVDAPVPPGPPVPEPDAGPLTPGAPAASDRGPALS